MRVIAHPFRLDSSGAVVTIPDETERYAAQLAGVVAATTVGERPLAPTYGMLDPTATPLSLSVIAATINNCEPDVTVTYSSSSLAGTSAQVRLGVTWAD